MSTQTSHPSASRKRRAPKAPNASVACEACRVSKKQCDEARPQCGNCYRRGESCEYREPFYDKLERSTKTITDSLRRIENKLDSLTHSESERSGGTTDHTPSSLGQEQAFATTSSHGVSHDQTQDMHGRVSEPEVSPVLLWPAFYQVLTRANPEAAISLSRIHHQGSFWFINHEIRTRKAAQLPGSTIQMNPVCPLWPTTERVQMTDLKLDWIMSRSEAYFNTFNVHFPILSKSHFTNHVCNNLLRDGFSEGQEDTVVALHVFALGEIAVSMSMSDNWTSAAQHTESGHQRRPRARAPGLTLFNEARRQQSMMHSHSLLEKVQALLLQGMYYDSASCYLDLWESLTAAAIACQILVKAHGEDWSSARSDFVKRAYWTCVLIEEFFHVDLDLPPTGLSSLQDEVPFPHFHDMRHSDDCHNPRQKYRSESACLQFLAMLTLRRLVTRIHCTLHNSAEQYTVVVDDSQSNILAELACQLDTWQTALPVCLQWSDELFSTPPPFLCPQGEDLRIQSQSDSVSESRNTSDLRSLQAQSDYNTPASYEDIDFVFLRIRYYYARLIVELPLLHKCLHAVEDISQDEKIRCGQAIQYACEWSLVMPPLVKDHQRLVPQSFACTHNFIWITVLLHLATHNEHLNEICQTNEMLGRIARSKQQALSWLHDLSETDCVAHWAWQTLKLGELAASSSKAT